MKNIQNFKAGKYAAPPYSELAPDIYKCERGYVTSLCFEQEPEYGEGASAGNISQYPLEDILDRFLVHVSDFYAELNVPESQLCYLEFCGQTLASIQQLRSIIGKHVYNKTVMDSGAVYIDLVIE